MKWLQLIESKIVSDLSSVIFIIQFGTKQFLPLG